MNHVLPNRIRTRKRPSYSSLLQKSLQHSLGLASAFPTYWGGSMLRNNVFEETLIASPDFFPAPELSSLCDRFPSSLDDIHRKIYARCVAHRGAYPEPVGTSVRERSD